MSLNILLLLILPYAFYICGADDISCGGEWRSDNLTTIVNVDSDNYVDGIFHNLQLQVGDVVTPTLKIHGSPSPIVGVSAPLHSDAVSSHFQLPFFYGYFRLDVASNDVNGGTKKLYRSGSGNYYSI